MLILIFSHEILEGVIVMGYCVPEQLILIGNYLKIKKNMLEISGYNTSKVIGENQKNSMEFIPEIYTRVYTLTRDRVNVAMLG